MPVLGIELGHLALPGRHVSGLGELAAGLFALSADSSERDLIDPGRTVVVEAHCFGDRDVVYAAHLFKQLAGRVLVPLLGVGVAMDALVVAGRIPPTDGRGRGDEGLAGRRRVPIPADVPVEEPLAARTAQAERVVALDDPPRRPGSA